MKKLFIFSFIILIFLFSCETNNKNENINPLEDFIIEVENVEEDFNLPLYLDYEGNKYKLNYEVDNDVIKIIEEDENYLAKVTRKDSDEKVKINVIVVIDNKNYVKTFNLKVLKKEIIVNNNDIVILSCDSRIEDEINTIIKSLEIIYPNYNFELINSHYSYLDNDIKELEEQGKKVNLLFGESLILNKYKNNDVVDLNEYINDSKIGFNTFNLNNLNEEAIKQGNYNNKQIMLPYSLSLDIVRINKHFINYLIEKEYISEDEVVDIENWSWNDYLEFSDIITSNFGDKPDLFASDSFSNSVMLRLLQYNAINNDGYNKEKIIEVLNIIKNEYNHKVIEYGQVVNGYIASLAPYDENEPKNIHVLFAYGSLSGINYDDFDLEYIVMPPFKEENKDVTLFANSNSMMMFDSNNDEINNIIYGIMVSLLNEHVQATLVNGFVPVNYDAYNSDIYSLIIDSRYSLSQEMVKKYYNNIRFLPLDDKIIDFYSDLNNNTKDILINNKINEIVNSYF